MTETEAARKAMRIQAAVQCMTTILTALRIRGLVISRVTGAIADTASCVFIGRGAGPEQSGGLAVR